MMMYIGYYTRISTQDIIHVYLHSILCGSVYTLCHLLTFDLFTMVRYIPAQLWVYASTKQLVQKEKMELLWRQKDLHRSDSLSR